MASLVPGKEACGGGLYLRAGRRLDRHYAAVLLLKVSVVVMP